MNHGTGPSAEGGVVDVNHPLVVIGAGAGALRSSAIG